MPSFQALLLVSGRGCVELVLLFLYSKDLVALFPVFCIISAHTQSATIEPFIRKRKNNIRSEPIATAIAVVVLGSSMNTLAEFQPLNSAGDLGKG